MENKDITLDGVAADFISTLIPQQKARSRSRIAFVSVAIEIHFNWQLAKETTLQVSELVREMLPQDHYDLIVADEPFQDHNQLKAFLDDAAHQGWTG